MTFVIICIFMWMSTLLVVMMSLELLPIGLSGLPDEWRLLLESSNISKDDVINNGEAVINALAYQFKPEAIPTAQDMLDMDAMLRDSKCVLFGSFIESFIREEDPKEYYRGLKEVLGEGGYSTVYT